MTAHLDAAINQLDDDYHQIIEAYKSIAQKRKILLRQKQTRPVPTGRIVLSVSDGR
ncbi:MAG: hypothetical protein ABGZ23_10895 [Fuerstiella sp.]